jgi:predicted metal-dependent peptidase
MTDDVETKLSAARTRLILDKPFLGALVLRLPMVAGDPKWCKSTATDARTFYYNKQYIDSLSLAQTQFVLAHEALHCALSHFARRQHRVKHRWDLACDFAVNPLLINDGLTPTPDALYIEQFDGMTAEEIYPNLDDNMDEEPQDQHLYDEQSESDSDRNQGEGLGDRGDNPRQEGEGSGREGEIDENAGGAPQPPPLSETEKQNLAVQWQQRLAGAAQQAMQAGKMGAAMARMVDHMLQPQLPWRMLLARYLSAVARDDYSYMRPSRREGEGNAIFPSLRSSQVDMAIVLDTSGSVDDEEIAQFLGEVNAIKGQLRARITVHACDAELSAQGPWTFEAWEDIKLPEELHGGGGTSFVPAFEWANRLDRQPDLFVYFTDAEGEFPQTEPTYPVLWLVKGKATVPFGQRVQLN